MFAILGFLLLYIIFRIIGHFTDPTDVLHVDNVDTNVNSHYYHHVMKEFSKQDFALEFLPFDLMNSHNRYMDMNLMNQTIEFKDQEDKDSNQTFYAWRVQHYRYNTDNFFEVLRMEEEALPEANSKEICIHIIHHPKEKKVAKTESKYLDYKDVDN